MANSYWFKHDDNARNDESIQDLIYEMGFEGYGLYWAIVEDLIKNDGYMKTNYKRIAYALRVEKQQVKQVVEKYDLFKIEDEQFTSKRVLKELEDRDAKIKRAKKGAEARWGDKNKDKKSKGNANGNAQANAQADQTADAYIDRDIEKDIKKEKAMVDKSPDFSNESFLDDGTFHNLPNKQCKKIANRINQKQFELSKSFIQYQKNQFPELVKNDSFKDILKGADTVRLLQEQDEFEFDNIKDALSWAVRNDFWSDKILSLAAIRNKSNNNGNKKFVNMYRNYKKSKGYKNKSQYERLKDELE